MEISGKDEIEKLKEQFKIKDEKIFENYEKKAKFLLTIGKRKSKDKTLVIVGGQSGAGKFRLRKLTNSEFPDAVTVDFDELRSLHPFYKEVNEKYPEITHLLLQKDTNDVKNKILDYLISERI